MGIWDSWFGAKTDDPLKSLDPKLREFLQRESPIKINKPAPSQQRQEEQEQQRDGRNAPASRRPEEAATTKPTTAADAVAAAAATTAATATATADATSSSATSAATDTKPPVPAASLYQDGRYAHLWKTYRPQAEVEAEGKTDRERLLDVVEGLQKRKNLIGRAALENCAEEQVSWNNCARNPDFKDRWTMCRDQMRVFERCYVTQEKILKALGYLSVYDRPPDVEEAMQMRADELFREMARREETAEKAKAEGKPVPQFTPLWPAGRAAWAGDPGLTGTATTRTTTTPAGATATATATANTVAAAAAAGGATNDDEWEKKTKSEILRLYKDKFATMSAEERPVALESFMAERRAERSFKEGVDKWLQDQDKQRLERKVAGKATFGDTMTALFRLGK